MSIELAVILVCFFVSVSSIVFPYLVFIINEKQWQRNNVIKISMLDGT